MLALTVPCTIPDKETLLANGVETAFGQGCSRNPRWSLRLPTSTAKILKEGPGKGAPISLISKSDTTTEKVGACQPGDLDLN